MSDIQEKEIKEKEKKEWGVMSIFQDTVNILISESFAIYLSSPAKWLCMVYVPAVVGAVWVPE